MRGQGVSLPRHPTTNAIPRWTENQRRLAPPIPPASGFRARHNDEKRSASRHLTKLWPFGLAPACAAGPDQTERFGDDGNAWLRIGGNTGRRVAGDYLSARSAAAREESHKRQCEPPPAKSRALSPDDAEHEALHDKVRASGKRSLGAYVMHLAAIEAGADSRPRASDRSVSVDTTALTQALVELNRVGNNLNQIARALNELALVAHEQSSRRLELRIEELAAAIRGAPDALAVPLAAIHAALSRDREG